MPIKPENKHFYGAEWHVIRERILVRDGRCCSFCGVKDRAIGARDREGVWHNENEIHNMNCGDGEMLFDEFPKMIQIILTIAHLDQNPANMDDGNLTSLCQKCHLNFDKGQHQYNSMITRLKKNRQAHMYDLLGINYKENENDVGDTNRE